MLSALARLVRGELAQLKLRQMWHLAAGLVVAVAALFGGLDSVDAKPKVFNVGQAYSDGEFTLTIARAAILDDVRAGERVLAPAKPGRVCLGMVMTIRNDGTIRGLLKDELDLPDQPRKQFTGSPSLPDRQTA